MNEITDTLGVFFNIFREDILEYYQKSYSYLKELIAYKNIDLNKKIEIDNESQIQNTLGNMLKAVKTGLNTIGISMDKLNENQKNFKESLSKERHKVPDYNSYFEIYLKNYVNNQLFEIIIEYLLNIDAKKLENVNLFDLVPPYFISRLNEFKKSHFSNASIVEMFKLQNYKKFINFTDLTIIKPKEVSDSDILTQLREAKEEFIETLKTPKKELLKQSIGVIQEEPISEKKISQIKVSEPIPQMYYDLNIVLNTGNFLDNFGHFPPIHPNLINKFKIDKLSLINSKVVNRDYFDLESLFYYISIIKMLNLEFPFTSTEIVEMLKNFINGWVFSSSKDNAPSPIDNFYGLAIFSELDLINKTDIIDLQEIENFILGDLEKYLPEKLELNLHSLLCIKLLIKIQKKSLNRSLNLGSISNLNLFEIENFKPTLDIFNHLASLKLLGQEANINQLKTLYVNELNKLIDSNGSVNDLITESARTLLIFDLINLKEKEPDLCSKLLNFILNKTSFFFMENVDKDFNWRSDVLCFKIELEILY